MRNTLVSAVVGAAVGVAAVGIAASGILGIFDKDKKMVYATITLDRINADTCVITTTPQTLEVRKRETVEWTIVDRCGVTLPKEDLSKFVTIAFETDPLETGCVKEHKKLVKCKVKQDVSETSYKYTVSAPNALTEDPVLEIVQ